MATDELPTVTHEGVVKIGDLEIKVLRLSSGESVIEEESFFLLMNAIFGGIEEQAESDAQC